MTHRARPFTTCREIARLGGRDSGRRAGRWSGKRDSNPRPSAWKADALPTELFPRGRRRWWWGKDSNLRRHRRQIYSLFPLTAREPHHGERQATTSLRRAASDRVPSPAARQSLHSGLPRDRCRDCLRVPELVPVGPFGPINARSCTAGTGTHLRLPDTITLSRCRTHQPGQVPSQPADTGPHRMPVARQLIQHCNFRLNQLVSNRNSKEVGATGQSSSGNLQFLCSGIEVRGRGPFDYAAPSHVIERILTAPP